ncbi:MAG: methionyl-tRNA formyltransferase [Thermomicrobiales bacterium]|nr:methionyl-tRNA formyltransferase [Thermomicrobiales bacterium]MCO5225038.1 methionyl-tRNA formyltransferase [Thermomicrobiales bacterium]MCO5227859.1 methionyl-tRNA formyltransferase [Thermomicrobiales bacterium]
MSKPRVIFMGTPAFAVPALEVLAARDDIDLCLVVTQPDRPAGRGKKLTSPPVKDAAIQLGLPLLQTATLRAPEVKDQIIALKPDLVVVAAFGMILGKWILELPRCGCVNLHASRLPKHRGASPISAAILAGDDVTGVTLMQMDRGLDTGDILFTTETLIKEDDTTWSLTPRLAEAGAALLGRHLSDILIGNIAPISQPEGATETRQLTKADGEIDWSRSAEQIDRQVRAMWDWPRAWTDLANGERLQVHQVAVVPDRHLASGELTTDSTGAYVGTGQGTLQLVQVQYPGGKPVTGQALIQKMSPRD